MIGSFCINVTYLSTFGGIAFLVSEQLDVCLGPQLLTWMNSNPTMDKQLQSLLRFEISSPFPIFNDAAVEICVQIKKFIPHFIGYIITYPWYD